jgi:hypothetical protein
MMCLSDSTLAIESFEGAVFEDEGSSVVRELLLLSAKPRAFNVSDPALQGEVRSSVSSNSIQAWLSGGTPTTIRAIWRVRGARPLAVSVRCMSLGGINEVSLCRGSEIVLEDDCQVGGSQRTIELAEGDYVLRAWTLDGQLAVQMSVEHPAPAEVR